MHPHRYDGSDRPRLTSVSAASAPERHPRLILNWSDDAGRTRTSIRAVSGIPVVVVEGALAARSAKPCREALGAVLRMRPTRVVLDLGGVRESDRTTVELLEAMRRFAHWHGVALSLASVPGTVAARLDAVAPQPPFDAHATSERAVQAALMMPRSRRSAVPRDSLGGL
jgi:anti-anti-sigma regulatory factor